MTDFTFAVARIRSRENSLLGSAQLDQLIAAKSYEEARTLLAGFGWGEGKAELPETEMLAMERKDAWDTIRELAGDSPDFLPIMAANDYQNLKAAVKLSCTGKKTPNVFINEGITIDPRRMLTAIQEKQYQLIPYEMAELAQEACEIALHTGDGQRMDMLIDRAALIAVRAAGRRAETAVADKYSELICAMTDIKIAYRCALTGRTQEVIRGALAPCDTLHTERLANAAAGGVEALCDYVSGAGYSDVAEALRKSGQVFEKLVDNKIIALVSAEKYEIFTAGPLIAWLLGRENEIKTVRILLSGKRNGFSEEWIRERVREMYG